MTKQKLFVYGGFNKAGAWLNDIDIIDLARLDEV